MMLPYRYDLSAHLRDMENVNQFLSLYNLRTAYLIYSCMPYFVRYGKYLVSQNTKYDHILKRKLN